MYISSQRYSPWTHGVQSVVVLKVFWFQTSPRVWNITTLTPGVNSSRTVIFPSITSKVPLRPSAPVTVGPCQVQIRSWISICLFLHMYRGCVITRHTYTYNELHSLGKHSGGGGGGAQTHTPVEDIETLSGMSPRVSLACRMMERLNRRGPRSPCAPLPYAHTVARARRSVRNFHTGPPRL